MYAVLTPYQHKVARLMPLLKYGY